MPIVCGFVRWTFYRTCKLIGYAYQITDRNGGKQMVAQMSKKSKIYHRPGCRFINRIEEDSLVTFDFEDGRIEDYST